ncbi:ParE toxin of type II toxin-antitoxin system, parDE [Rubritalea squalenifaciens DSM 18772]|uniref:ParE toxin of type II toxin-antitoxin system, parDE n=1 Tax=Rubritalea squalenifaciens DSM 18772 TaxID=1123071 RepID=A0A1M6H526_9BACT|nr:type II toxin-antitoxin system RelE/ParE family toxin [Rubritalea squalenifaciens]SHJ17189.1 ParE toxin of type II toxin-antitoxin system, parDE [Rubritalea squalenifaciens DSM 18772]
MADYKLSLLAEEDLISIYAYTYETWGIEQLDTYKGYLTKALEEITADPFGIGSKSRDDLAEGCRTYRVQHHYYVYRVKNSTVETARVLHEYMDFHLQTKESYFPI